MPMSESRPMKHIRGYLTPIEIKQLITQSEGERNKLLIRLLYETGARISEVVGIRKQDSIDGKEHREEVGLKPHMLYPDRNPPEVFLYTIKRSRKNKDGERKYDFGERYKSISRDLMGRLISYIGGRSETREEKDYQSRIFDITRVWANKLIAKTGERTNLDPRDTSEKWIHPHHFRHSFAIKFVVVNDINDIPGVKALQSILDHRNMMTTFEYLQFSGREDIEKMFEQRVFPQTAFLRG